MPMRNFDAVAPSRSAHLTLFDSYWLLFTIGALVAGLSGEAFSEVQESIVLGGEMAPDSGGGTFGLLGQPDLNDDGEVMFFASIVGGDSSQGIFVGDGTTIRSVAQEGDVAPGGLGTFSGFFLFSGKIDDQGGVAFLASMTGGPSASGIFHEGSSGLAPLAVVGQPASGAAGNYISLAQPDLNDDGEVAFVGVVFALPPVVGIFIESATSGRLVVEVGDPAPGMPGGTFESFGNPVLNDDGEVAFTADVNGPGGITSGIWIFSAAGLGTLVAQEGEVAPGTGGATFEPFNTAARSIDATGNVYFQADLSSVAIGDGHFMGNGGSITLLAFPGDPVPGTGDPTIDSLASEPDASRTGGVSFIASLEGNTADEGVYLDRALDGARLEIAREDDVAPDTAGGTLQGFSGRTSPNVSGDVAFLCGVAGSPTTTVGIFVPEPAFGACLWIGTVAFGMLGRRRTAFRGDRIG